MRLSCPVLINILSEFTRVIWILNLFGMDCVFKVEIVKYEGEAMRDYELAKYHMEKRISQAENERLVAFTQAQISNSIIARLISFIHAISTTQLKNVVGSKSKPKFKRTSSI